MMRRREFPAARFVAVLFLQHIYLNRLTTAYTSGDYTISQLPEYTNQQVCVQNCLMNYYPDNGSKLPGHLDCYWNGVAFQDECVCRANLASAASAFLSSCASSACSQYPEDVASAVSLYDGYCHRNGLVLGVTTPASNVGTTTLGGDASAPTVLVITTVYTSGATSTLAGTQAITAPPKTPITLYSTQTIHGDGSTGSSSAAGSGGGGLSTSDKIALGCGLSVPIAALLFAIYAKFGRKRSLRA